MPPDSNELQVSSESDQTTGDLNKGGEVDYQALFEQQNQELESTKAALGKTEQDLHSVKKTANETATQFEKIKTAIMGDDAKGGKDADPAEVLAQTIAELEAEADQYLQAAIEAEKAGRAIPLTVNNAIRRIQHQINTAKENFELKARLGKLEGDVKQARNPGNTIDDMAYSNMDNHIMQAMETIYGPEEGYAQIKDAQFNATSKLLVDEIKRLKDEQPDIWNRIRRDQGAQAKMVNHFVKQTIPPKARQLMDEDHIKRTPMTMGELHAAWREARELAQQDPKAKKYETELRQELLGAVYNKSAGKRGAISQLYKK